MRRRRKKVVKVREKDQMSVGDAFVFLPATDATRRRLRRRRRASPRALLVRRRS